MGFQETITSIFITIIVNLIIPIITAFLFKKSSSQKFIKEMRHPLYPHLVTSSIVITLVTIFVFVYYFNYHDLKPSFESIFISSIIIGIFESIIIYYGITGNFGIHHLPKFFEDREIKVPDEIKSIALFLKNHADMRESKLKIPLILLFLLSFSITEVMFVFQNIVYTLKNPSFLFSILVSLGSPIFLTISIVGFILFIDISKPMFIDIPVFISDSYDHNGHQYYGFLIDNTLIIGFRQHPIYKPSDLQILSIIKKSDFMNYFSVSSDDYISSLLRWIAIEKEFYKEKWVPYLGKEWKKYFVNDIRKLFTYWLYPLEEDKLMRSKIDIDKLENAIKENVINKILREELGIEEKRIKKLIKFVNKSFREIHKLKLKEAADDE